MPSILDPRDPTGSRDATAFDVWFRRRLKDAFEPVVHEPLPPQILDFLEALPPLEQRG